MKKITKNEPWRQEELFFTNQENKEAEKEEFMKEFSSIWDETLGKIDGICLYLSSANRKIKDEEYHHKRLSDVKELYLSELSEIFDRTRFSKVEIRRPSSISDELEVVLWVQITEGAANGHAVYVRFCTDETYENVKHALENEETSERVKSMYLDKLANTFFEPDAERIKKSVDSEIKDIISDAISEVKDNWISSFSLRKNDALEEILEVLEESTLYQDIKDILTSEYKDDDLIIFSLNGVSEPIMTLNRQTIVTHDFVW